MTFRPRTSLAQALVRFGQLVKSLSLSVMRPDDLIEFGRRNYSEPRSVEGWSTDTVADSGLYEHERALVDELPEKAGRCLVLGAGGGREAIPLAKLGFRVTGMDFIPAMVRRMEENARRHGVELEGVVGEVSRIDFPDSTFDVIMLSAAMYSCIPTRKKRIETLARIRRALKPGGYFIGQFFWDPDFEPDAKGEVLRRIVAIMTLGHLRYEKGDMLWGYGEFVHAFRTEAELRAEFAAGGFEVLRFVYPEHDPRSGALLRKPAAGSISSVA